MRACIAALTLAAAGCLACAAEYHVSKTGRDDGAGSEAEPFRTISAAACAARPGDIVTVHAGIYRERVNPPRGGESDARRIVYQAAAGEDVVITGSEIVKGWQQAWGDSQDVAEGVWKVVLPNGFFGDYNPYADVIRGEWHSNVGYPRHTGAVYVNGQWLDEAPDLQHVLSVPSPTVAGGRPLWHATVDANATTIWAQFGDVNPNDGTVEINVRRSVFYPDKPGRNYITVRGFTLRNAATPWSGAMSEQIGLIGTHWSRGWVIENNVISHSMNTGITLGRYDLGAYGIAKPPATAPGYVESIELARKHGWSKENIGGHVVRYNRISHCEKNGIHGSLGGIFSVIEGNTICEIAAQRWIGGADVAGLKLLGSVDTVIRGNHIYRCGGSGGVWLDWMAQGTRMTGNLLHDNSQDLFVEVNHGPFLIDNNFLLSARSLSDWSEGGAYAHNLIAGQVRSTNQNRRTPYFKPHSVEGMALSDITRKDNRFCNNLFIGPAGLAGHGKAGTELQAAGNVYLAGAKPSAGDRDALVLADFQPGMKLREEPDGWWLEMAVDPVWLSAPKRSVVTTETLGKAKVPEAAFERPDGSPHRLDTDYSGAERDAKNPAPGPLRFPAGKVIRVKVWPKQ